MNLPACTIQVHLTHACPIMRAGWHAILSTQSDFTISATPQRLPLGREACVIVTDYAGGMRATRDIWPRHPAQPTRVLVLVLTTYDKEWEVRHAMDSGVHGYLLQGCDGTEVIASIRMLSQGNSYLSEPANRSVADSLRRLMLTPRETEVLPVLARGSSDKLIARELGITIGTVKSHMKQVLHKLGASARTQAVVVAMQRGLFQDQGQYPAVSNMS